MRILSSSLNKKKANYIHNEEANKKSFAEFDAILKEITLNGNKKSRAKHTEKGKLLVRERIDLLLDSKCEFLELSALAAYNQYDNQFPSAGIITGIGIVHGQEVMIVANDATAKGGTYVKETIKKHLRAQEIALQNRLPIIYLVDSGGIYLPEQANVYPDKEHFGRIFYNQSILSAENIPQIAVVMGYCTAGGAYIPAMCDENIIVEGTGTIFLAGPSLVEQATGEKVSDEDLGGARVCTSISGVADHIAYDDEDAIIKCREIMAYMHPKKPDTMPRAKIEEPKYPIEDILGLIPSDNKIPYDVYELITRLVDGSRFQEFKENYGTTIVTGFGRINGRLAGFVANNGILFSESAQKATHFIELCNHRQIPIIFLHNIVGFMVGKEYEHKGIAKDGAKMIHAVANANVPKITLITGISSGAGNYAMAGRAYNPNFLFIWPNANTAVMGSDQAAGVLNKLKNKSKANTPEESEKLKQEVKKRFEEEGSAYYSTSRLWDDGIINPLDTRHVLSLALEISANSLTKEPKIGVYRM